MKYWIEEIPTILDFTIEFCSPKYVCSIFEYLYNKNRKTRSLLNESYIKIKTKLLCETQSELESILHLK